MTSAPPKSWLWTALKAGCALGLCASLALPACAGGLAPEVPNPTLTPGTTNPDVTPDTIATTICATGWSASVRPRTRQTDAIKSSQLKAGGYDDQKMQDYEEDHLIPIEIGGALLDPLNLWPQPLFLQDGWDAAHKDQLENVLRARVCHGEITLAVAQSAIASNWKLAYQYFVLGQGQ